ncbi:glycosyltransferase family 2 protein [Thermoplasmatales archaeon AK]|nr:glycosyltransferase family 2 protein [Thermoplasmatales archaeon AK]
MSPEAIVFSYGSKEDIDFYADLSDRVPLDRFIMAIGGNFSEGYLNSLSKHKKLVVMYEKERRGKYYSLMAGLSKARDFPLFLISGDIRVDDDVFSKVLNGLSDEREIVMPRVIPQNTKSLPEKIGSVIWAVHAFVNDYRYRRGKFFSCGELQVISHPFPTDIPKVINEDEYLCEALSAAGFKLTYRKDIVVNNLVPRTIRDLMVQRIRINIGHLQVAEMKGRTSSLSVSPFRELRTIAHLLVRIVVESPQLMLYLPLTFVLEMLSVIIAIIKFRSGKIELAWKIVNPGAEEA